MTYYEYYQVEIRYQNGEIEKEFYIKNIEDDIIVEYDDEGREDGLYINTTNKGQIRKDISNIDEIWIEYIEEGYVEDRYLFWTS